MAGEKKEEKKEGAKDAKKKGGKEEKKEEKEAKFYTIPLRDAFSAPRKKRVKKAVKIVRDYLTRHLKSDNIKISSKLNEALWGRGIEKPPRKIKVKVTEKEEEKGVYTADAV